MRFKNLFLIVFLLANNFIQAQFKVHVSKKDYNLEHIDIAIGNLTVVLNKDGVIENFYANEMNGDVDYYSEGGYFEGFKKGKIKSVGNIMLDYYDIWNKDDGNYDKFKKIGDLDIKYWETSDESKVMKVKKIGDILIDYWGYDTIDNGKFGKLKSIGDMSIDYEMEKITNQNSEKKLIKFGTVVLDYWNDILIDKEKFGKLKSIKGTTKDILFVLE